MRNRWLVGTLLLLLAGCEVQPAGDPVVFTAKQAAFVHEVSARGTVFSHGGKEVCCEVDSPGTDGTIILELVREGASVQPGDPLVQLDISALKENLLQQQILCNGLEAAVIAAASEREKAQLSREEYLNGLYPEEKKAAEDSRFGAQSKLEQAERILKAAEDDVKPAEGTAEDVDALQFNVEMAKRRVEAAENRISVLDSYTRPRQLKQLDGEVKSAEAMMRAKEAELSLQRGRLAKIEGQIAACTIAAPTSGVVFYAHVPGETEEDEILIGEGLPVRNRQVILRLAQLDQLSVRIEADESDIGQLHIDMLATIYVDSMLDTPFDGRVSKIHPYPTRQTRGSTDKKKYEVHVVIDNPSGTLRPGLTCEVVLTLSELADAIQVPATSVFEENGTKFCLVLNRRRWKLRPVVLGPTDDKMVVIDEGLQPGEDVAIHPLQHRQQASP